jgi:hypothetical protein
VGGGGGLSYLSEFTALGVNGEIDHPADYTLGDELLIFGGGRSGPTYTLIDYTWAAWAGGSSGGNAFCYYSYRTSAEVIASETMNYSFGRTAGWCLIAVSGGVFHLGGGASGYSTTPQSPDITTTADGCRIFRAMGVRDTSGTVTPGSGTVVANEEFSEGRLCVVDEGIQGAAGATGTYDFATSVEYSWYAVTVAVEPS